MPLSALTTATKCRVSSRVGWTGGALTHSGRCVVARGNTRSASSTAAIAENLITRVHSKRAMRGRRPDDPPVREPDLFTEKLDRPCYLQYVLTCSTCVN